jgi:hypothetical protein
VVENERQKVNPIPFLWMLKIILIGYITVICISTVLLHTFNHSPKILNGKFWKQFTSFKLKKKKILLFPTARICMQDILLSKST